MKKAIQIGVWAAGVTLFALTALPCPAADSAVLRNGFSIRHERRQVMGSITRLYVDGDNSSFVDVPTEEIDHFEASPIEVAAPQAGKTEPASRPELQPSAANVS